MFIFKLAAPLSGRQVLNYLMPIRPHKVIFLDILTEFR